MIKAPTIPTFFPGQSTAPAAERLAMERGAMADSRGAMGGSFYVGQPVKVVEPNGSGVLWDEIADISASKIRLSKETRPGWNLDGSPSDPVHQGRRLVPDTWKK